MNGRTFFAGWLKSLLFIVVALVMSTAGIQAQKNDYEKALSKFTGEHKWDIEKPGSMDGVPAPPFKAVTLDKQSIDLDKLKGKVVVLNFWYIACKPCRVEVTPLNEMVKQFEKEKEVLFVSIARDEADALRAHLKNVPFSFKTIPDPEAILSDKTFHVLGYPTTIVIDRAGVIRYYTLGGKIKEEDVRKELQNKLVPAVKKALADTPEKSMAIR